MGATNWTAVPGSVATSVVDRGVIYTPNVAPGGGSFVYAFHTIAPDGAGVVALRSTVFLFAPAASGSTVRAVLKRGATFVDGGFAPLVFCALQTDDVSDDAYILGIGDAEPSHIVLRKGALEDGVPDVAPGSQGVLRRSSETFARDTWLHLRLDAEEQGNGDVILRVYRNFLEDHELGFPASWEAIGGMAEYTDVAGGALVGGYAGFGFRTEDDARKHAFVDQIEIFAQRG